MKNKAKQIIIVMYILIGFFFVAIIVAKQGLTNPLSFFSKAASSTATIIVQPTTSTMPPNKTYQIWTTSEVGVGFIRISLEFDQNKMQLTGEPTIVLPRFNKILLSSMAEANATGKIIFVAGLDPSQIDSAPSGTYQFANIPLAAKATQTQITTQLTVAITDSQIVDMNANELTLSANNTSITINPEITTTLMPTIIVTDSPAITNTITQTKTPTPTHIKLSLPTPVSVHINNTTGINISRPSSTPQQIRPTVTKNHIKRTIVNRKSKAVKFDIATWRKLFRDFVNNFPHF